VVRWLLVMVCSLLVTGLVMAVLRGIGIAELVPLAAILLVSAIPVALPTLFAITMALGSSELAKKRVLVTRLSATEDAAVMDALCVDKTGTLTLNRLAIVDVIAAGEFKEEDVVLFGALARSAGLPTRLVGGLVYAEGRFFYHAWVECWTGAWTPFDATMDTDFVDATHMKFAQGDPTDMMMVFAVVGKLSVKVLDSGA